MVQLEPLRSRIGPDQGGLPMVWLLTSNAKYHALLASTCKYRARLQVPEGRLVPFFSDLPCRTDPSSTGLLLLTRILIGSFTCGSRTTNSNMKRKSWCATSLVFWANWAEVWVSFWADQFSNTHHGLSRKFCCRISSTTLCNETVHWPFAG
jgi:hypothetical protein